eukprot:6629960-Pyramimonas_sp.AAC.1
MSTIAMNPCRVATYRKTRTVWDAVPAHRPFTPSVCELTISKRKQSAKAARRNAWRCLITSEFCMLDLHGSAVCWPSPP